MWAIVGSFGDDTAPGGIDVFRFDPDTRCLNHVSDAGRPLEAGYIKAGRAGRVYAVDERKTDGRGPVGAASGVHAFAFDRRTGALDWLGMQATPGPFPTFLDFDAAGHRLVSASHGSFDHVERVVRRPDDSWTVEYVYDASTVVLHRLDDAGRLDGILDVIVLEGHGKDPNFSRQAGGHCQSTAHAHCASIDPSGRFVIVCDKGTDSVITYRLGEGLLEVSRLQLAPETAPRHVAFTADGRRMVMSVELSCELAALDFDPETGALSMVDRISTVAADFIGINEPAELRLHPNEQVVYVNNRGEDSLCWFDLTPEGRLTRTGAVQVARSAHPGVAARNFRVLPDGRTLLFADRPANAIRIYDIDAAGGLTEIGQAPTHGPVYIELVEEE